MQGILSRTVLTLGASSSLMMTYAIPLVLWPTPWYDVKTVLPVVGLLLGNLVNGVSFGLSMAMDELTTGLPLLSIPLACAMSC